jgi:hypothetical protein
MTTSSVATQPIGPEFCYRVYPLNSRGKRRFRVHVAEKGIDESLCGVPLGTEFKEETERPAKEDLCGRCRPHVGLVVSISAKEAMYRFREGGDGALIDFPLDCRTPDCDAREVENGLCVSHGGEGSDDA